MTYRRASGWFAVAVAVALGLTSCGQPQIAGSAAAGTSLPSESTADTSEAAPESTVDDSTTQTQPTQTEPTQTQVTESEPPATVDLPTTEETDTAETYVYFVIEGRNGFVLARELHDIPLGADGPVAALTAMIAGPDDPDYLTSWNPDTLVLGVDVSGGDITVNLSVEAKTANVGTAGAAIMLPQLIWTVTEAVGDPDANVQLEIDGEPTEEMFGAISWEGPLQRESAEWVRMPVQIDTPRDGVEVSSPVTISGDAAAFEATVPWRVLDEDGAEVMSGFTMTEDGTKFSPFSFEISIDPGRYVVEISEDDPSDGAGGALYIDTRTITVVG